MINLFINITPDSGSIKLLRESTNANRKWLKLAFSIANFRVKLPICILKRCFKAYRSAFLDSRDSSRLPPIRSEDIGLKFKIKNLNFNRMFLL